MGALVIQLVIALVPVISPIIARLLEKNDGKMPTDDEIIAELMKNTDTAISEADAWIATHPKA